MSYFKDIPKIKFEGPKSTNPLAFKHYNPSQKIEGKAMYLERLGDTLVGCGIYKG